jgi:hypothetical protein
VVVKYIQWPIGIWACWVVFNTSRGFSSLGVDTPAVYQILAAYFTAPVLRVWGQALKCILFGGLLGIAAYWLMRATALAKTETPRHRFRRACIHAAAAAAGIAGVYVLWQGIAGLVSYAASATMPSG